MRPSRFGSLPAFTLVVVLLASACAAGEARGGPGADEVPQVSGMCAEDAPDCQDTLVGEDPPTGGDTPLAPDTAEPGVTGLVVGGGLSIAEALAYEGTEPVAVTGFIVGDRNQVRLCEALAESYPPQCGGPSLVITNPEPLSALPLVEEGSTQWSEEPVTLLGTVAAGELTIATNVTG